jgi:transcriptional regulator with XRE-family HTH domain
MSFGSTIKRFRKEKGYTQDQLANLLSVTPQAISRWENNSAMPDISLLIPIKPYLEPPIRTGRLLSSGASSKGG